MNEYFIVKDELLLKALIEEIVYKNFNKAKSSTRFCT